MKIGIVVPFSWSYWGGVVEHSEHQAAALRRRGHDVQILMGNDPPGRFTRLLHPRTGRHGHAARRDHPGRPLGRRACERLVAEHRPLAARDRPHPPRPRARSSSTSCTARADDAGDLRRGALVRAMPDRRHPSRARRPRLDGAGAALLGLPDGPHRRAHRRLADGCRVGGALAPRRLPRDPERRADSGARRSRRPRSHRRLHRPPRRAQGPAGAAARLAARSTGDRRAAAR